MRCKYLLWLLLFICLTGCTGNKTEKKQVRIFHAPCFSPVIDQIIQSPDLFTDYELETEVSGSQVVCRKVTELGRQCDLMMLADNQLFALLTKGKCSWRIDFAHDEIVLGIGLRAPHIDQAEKDWAKVLIKKDIALGRVDENLGPIGYRTLICWKLKELQGHKKLSERLIKNTSRKVEHVTHLATYLKTGNLDYGFLYRTTAMKYDIRYISLHQEVNLSSSSFDYSKATVSFLKNGTEKIAMTGRPITFSLSIPEDSERKNHTISFVRKLIVDVDLFTEHGMGYFPPVFYGSQNDYKQFSDITTYGGTFEE